jgi:chromosome segregation ATPase
MTEFGIHHSVLESIESLGAKLTSIVNTNERERFSLENGIKVMDDMIKPIRERTNVVMQNNQALRLENASLARQLTESGSNDMNACAKSLSHEVNRNTKLRQRVEALAADNSQMSKDRKNTIMQGMNADKALRQSHEEEIRQQHITIRGLTKGRSVLNQQIDHLRKKLDQKKSDSIKVDKILSQCHKSMGANDARMRSIQLETEQRLETIRSDMSEQLVAQSHEFSEKEHDLQQRILKCQDMYKDMKDDMERIQLHEQEIIKLMSEETENYDRKKNQLDMDYNARRHNLNQKEEDLENMEAELSATRRLIDAQTNKLNSQKNSIKALQDDVTLALADNEKNATVKIKQLEDKIQNLLLSNKTTISDLRRKLSFYCLVTNSEFCPLVV